MRKTAYGQKMKRIIAIILVLGICFMSATVAMAEKKTISVTALTLKDTSVMINKGKTATLKATVEPKNASNKKLEWTSSDPAVATVKNGSVKAVEIGECDITCATTDGSEIKAVCHIHVIQMVSKVAITNKNVSIYEDEEVQLEATIQPEDATNPSVKWESSNPEVATVSEDGLLHGVAEGKCNITAMAEDGSKKQAAVKVTVESKYIFNSKWGENITCTIDRFGTLTMTGNGAPDDFLGAPWNRAPFTSTKYIRDPDLIKTVIIGEGITSTGSELIFQGNSLTSVTLPDSLVEVGIAAFPNCPNLVKINLPDRVKRIGDFAFIDATRLAEINIPENVEYIGEWAFSGCASLKEIILPRSIKEIGEDAFVACNQLVLKVYEGSYAEEYAKKNGLDYEVMQE